MAQTVEAGSLLGVPLAQSDQPANARAKPQLALRVGVTGARDLDQNRLHDLHDKVRAGLTRIRDEMTSLTHKPDVVHFYVANEHQACAPFLRLISPLARGTDRLVAEEALNLGYKLHVPMPFSRAEYERDFTGTDLVKTPNALSVTAQEDLQQFRELLGHAGQDWMSLDGDYDNKAQDAPARRDRAYEAAGRFVVRNSDIIISVWNGELAAGRGGTQQIIDYATKVGVPVWWIHATEKTESRWIAESLDTCELSAAPLAAEMISPYLRQLILGPESGPRNRQTFIARLARLRQSRTTNPAKVYFRERPHPIHPWWRFHSFMMRHTSRCKPHYSTASPKPPNDAGAYWFELYQPADARAVEYAARYRSSYVWIFSLTTFSLLLGGLANLFHGHSVFVVTFATLEIIALLATLLITIFALRWDWHERSIEYRLLAELCRKQQVLAPLGRPISFGMLRRLEAQIQETEDLLSEPTTESQVHRKHARGRAGWVNWLFMAYQRAAPLPRGNIAALLPGVLSNDVLQDLVNEQLEYHAGRAKTSAGAAEFFERVGGIAFFAVLFFVAGKIWLTVKPFGPDEATVILGFLGVFLPALSAAAVGIGSYAEWQVLAEDSNHMLNLLTLAKKRIQSIDLKRQLASQDLGAQADYVALTMLEDLEGWQRLFRVKMIETQ